MSLLEVDRVSHWYRTTGVRPVIDDISLQVDRNDIVAIVGESGCGKTTLGKIVAGLIAPSSGSIRFDQTEISELRGRAFRTWRREVQLVHQDPYGSLNPGLTIGAALGPPLVRHGLVSRRQVESTLLDALHTVGLDATADFLHRYPHQLSGGQRQRVAIARAIAMQPRLIVADEVTSMLDVSMRVSILDLLLSFRRDRPLAYMFISHDFGVVRYFTQGGRIIVMFYGVIVEDGPTEQLIAAPKHPYTHLLLEAIPVPNPALADRRDPAEGRQGLIAEPSREGCVFANRCPLAQDICRRQAPPLAEVGAGHRAACYFSDRVPPIRNGTQGGDQIAQTGSTSTAAHRAGNAGDVPTRASRGSVEGGAHR